MAQKERSYRAICFDLDGTLLPMDIDEFMNGYFSSLRAFVESEGVDGAAFSRALKAGTKAMAVHDGTQTNAEAYWECFMGLMGGQRARWQRLMEDYYSGPFTAIGKDVEPDPAAARAVRTLYEKGYPLALTTMPMFPLAAVKTRLAWAGVDPGLFARITHYENSTAVKPRQTYYAENLAALGVPGGDVLMVGNNTMEDLSFMELGADGYLVTDWLLDPVNYPLGQVKHSSMEEFARWAEALPVCANPASSVEAGRISSEAAEEALAANAVGAVDREAAAAKAAQVADMVAAHGEDGEDGR